MSCVAAGEIRHLIVVIMLVNAQAMRGDFNKSWFGYTLIRIMPGSHPATSIMIINNNYHE
jgi:hypothetical protein